MLGNIVSSLRGSPRRGMAHNCRLGVRTVHLRALRSLRLTPIVRRKVRALVRKPLRLFVGERKKLSDRRPRPEDNFHEPSARGPYARGSMPGANWAEETRDGRGQNISWPGMKIISQRMS